MNISRLNGIRTHNKAFVILAVCQEYYQQK